MLIANFTNYGEEITVDGLWQYDYGQRLQINGLNLPDVFEVHLFWKGLEEAKVVTGYTENNKFYVDIPNESLKQRQAITVYIYLSTPETGKTVNTVMMFVNKRPEPEGFEIPEDIDLFHHTLTAVGEYTSYKNYNIWLIELKRNISGKVICVTRGDTNWKDKSR